MNRLPSVREGRAFRKWDILFYLLILLLAAALVLVAVFAGEKGESAGIRISRGGETVYIYRFGEGGETFAAEGVTVEAKEENGKVFVTVRAGEAFNTVEIDTQSRTARMSDANCSSHRDCVRMAPVDAEGFVLCAPHALCIEPLYEDLFRPTL